MGGRKNTSPRGLKPNGTTPGESSVQKIGFISEGEGTQNAPSFRQR